MEASNSPGRSVSLVVPAKPDYVVLARLALSAVCRLSPLAPEEVADLKLAITEASNYLMGGERRQSSRDAGDDGTGTLTFKFELADNSLELCVSGEEMPTVSAEERELSIALIKATVDSYEYDGDTMRLTKQLSYDADAE
jgi:Histidine kinase-like ATPase domain